MIVQACLNGSRLADYHPRLPIALDDLVREATECVIAGASEIHLHVHDRAGNESLQPEAVDETVRALRQALPGTLFGISSGEWIEGNYTRTVDCIRRWNALPDYASVNLSEPGANEVCSALLSRGVGIEAGIASRVEAEALIESGFFSRVLRVLVEMDGIDVQRDIQVASDVVDALERVEIRKSILLHGMDLSVWQLIEMAASRRFSTRVGLEDGPTLPDGAIADSNADLVKHALKYFQR